MAVSRRKLRLRRLQDIFGNRYVDSLGILILAFLVLIFKGPTGEGQPTLFGNLIKEYIDETSISIAAHSQSANQLADMSTLAVAGMGELGQGGQETLITPMPVNDNSLLVPNPVNTDYSGINGSKRNHVTEYIVQSGDLLSFIASDYGVSVNSIIWANKLRDADSISPGQTLKIPPVSGVIHEVRKGDSLTLIAKKYGVDEAKILDFNGLPQSGEIQIGDEIIVPDGQIKSVYAVSSGARTTAARFGYLPNLGDYFVQPTAGYNWGRIHGRNGVDVSNSCGTPIYAAAEGSIAIADGSGWNGGFGKFIKLIHPNGTETLYAHNTKLLVERGGYVQGGQMIALMGSTGRSTGCHLHFEVHGARNPLAKY